MLPNKALQLTPNSWPPPRLGGILAAAAQPQRWRSALFGAAERRSVGRTKVSTDIDETVEITAYDPRWARWYAHDAAELDRTLGNRLRAVEHFGSTAVLGLPAKPVIDVLVAPVEWPLSSLDRYALESLGYAYLGEAGVQGREHFRRRGEHATNLAVVEWNGVLWRDNLAVRDYLRSHPEAAARYAQAKQRVWAGGARTLIRYSAAKSRFVGDLIADAKRWRAG